MPPGGRKWHLAGSGACGENKRLLLCEDFCNCWLLCLPWTFASVTSIMVSRFVFNNFLLFVNSLWSYASSSRWLILYYIISSHPLWDLCICQCPLQLSLWIFLFILQNPLETKISVMLFKFAPYFVLGNITHLSWLKAHMASLRLRLDLNTFG